MGDGRYYTVEQFSTVAALLVLAIFLVINITYYYYRNSAYKEKRYMTQVLVTFEMIILLRLLEEIIISEIMAKTLRYTHTVLFLFMCLTFIAYLVVYIVPIHKKQKANSYVKKTGKIYLRLKLFLMVGLLVFLGEDVLIQQYAFDHVTYTGIYSSVVLGVYILFFMVIAKLIILDYKKNGKLMHKTGIVTILMCVFPFLMHEYFIENTYFTVDVIEIPTYYILILTINLSINAFTPYSITSIASDKIKEIISDYVIVTDELGQIIYKNRNISKVDFFTKDEVINIHQIGSFFKGETNEKEAQGKLYLQLKYKDNTHYFSHKVKALSSNNCYIITLTEITDIISMLHELEERKKEYEQVNKKHIDYSKQVYDLEKQKAINQLMEEIVESQNRSMFRIIDELEQGINKINDTYFEQYIDKVIANASCDLVDVRKAVSAYKGYHGG